MMVMIFIIPLDNAGISFKAFADMFEPITYASEISAVYVAQDAPTAISNDVNALLNSNEKNYYEETTTGYTETTANTPQISLYTPGDILYDYNKTFYINYDAKDCTYLDWSSSDESVATVNSSGMVTVKGQGEVTITATGYAVYHSNPQRDSVTFNIYTLSTTAPAYISLYEPDESDLYVGNVFAINYTSEREYSVDWESSDESIATVNKGQVTLNSYGTVTITATSNRGSYNNTAMDFITFTVPVPEPDIDLNTPSSSDLYKGNSFQIAYGTVNVPTNDIVWLSGDSKIATVDSTGNVTITGYGEVEITAIATGYEGLKAIDSITFTVYEPPTISLKQPAASSLFALNLFTLDYDSTNVNSIKWSSSDEYIATIDSNGRIKIVGYGTVTISAEVSNNSPKKGTDSVTFTVSASQQTGTITMIPERLTMNVGDTSEIALLNVPDGSAIKWISSSTNVATVSNGTVKAVGQGTAIIYAIVDNTVCECAVTVNSSDYLAGDANGDGEVDMGDAVAILKYLADPVGCALTEQGKLNGDVNLRGNNLDSSDALAIQKLRAKQISTLPESYYKQ